MVDGSFIVVGKGSESSLKSSSHGAGRVLSRRRAKDELDVEEFREDTKHLVSNHSDSNVDEAPKAYKNIFEVMDNQKDLVEVIDRVIPIINIKG
jgi:tRNA-splicing ligase RtcB